MGINLIRNLPGLIAAAVSLSGAFSCTKEHSLPQPGDPAATVRLDIYTAAADYSLPVTRAAENSFDNLPMVIVFNGHGPGAVFLEVNKAESNGSSAIVNLTATQSPATILLVTNVPDGQFHNGNTTVAFTKENIASALENKTLRQVREQGLLRTVSLPSPLLATLPYSEQAALLPMSALIELPSINSDYSIGTPDNYVKLVRAVAKVTVEVHPDLNDIFRLKAVAVIDAPVSGSLVSIIDIPGSGTLTQYGDDNSGMAQASMNEGRYTTKNDPIYLYEAPADQGTAMILKADVEGADKYFRLPFYNERDYMEIIRNKHYTFRIIGAGSGYDTFEEARASGGLPNFKYIVTVTDDNSYDVISNEKFYIGVTSSTIESYVQAAHSATFRIYTDAALSDGYLTSITADPGLTLSRSTIVLGGSGSPGETELTVTLGNGFVSGNVILRVGTLTKFIEVIRHPGQLLANVPLELPYSDYVWGLSRSPGWLYVSGDGTTVWEELEKDAPGKLYLVADPGGSGEIGEVLAFRGSSGRSSVYVKRP